ncbi:Rv1733c family protein [Streptomyces sp. SudanB182_2057]|uniref:Rv1733c family protein n=1 Tax=Streptomyces sp. SudanB182_2057 TaxID=3035281 RepID=UPI003F56AB23
MNTTRRMWRWRSNPLRRREDVVEAWVVLAVWVIAVVGSVLAGLVTAHAAEQRFAEQRAHRHAVRAVLVTDVPHGAAAKWAADGRTQGSVRWTAPDGTSRTGRTLVAGGLETGALITVWQDDQGRLMPSAPTSRSEGHVVAALFAGAAALAVAAPVLGAGAVARARLDRRRIAQWGQEWDLVGPRWGPKAG